MLYGILDIPPRFCSYNGTWVVYDNKLVVCICRKKKKKNYFLIGISVMSNWIMGTVVRSGGEGPRMPGP